MILLRYHQGYSVKEAAALMGLSFSAASSLEQQVKRKLKERPMLTDEMLCTAAAEADCALCDSLLATMG